MPASCRAVCALHVCSVVGVVCWQTSHCCHISSGTTVCRKVFWDMKVHSISRTQVSLFSDRCRAIYRLLFMIIYNSFALQEFFALLSTRKRNWSRFPVSVVPLLLFPLVLSLATSLSAALSRDTEYVWSRFLVDRLKICFLTEGTWPQALQTADRVL